MLAIQFGAAGELPTEFRLFVPGWNDTEKGRFLFDATAAAAVKSAYEKWGVDRMIDLEHLSLDSASVNYDPDARGWCKLELRSDGSLWAVGVSWTSDGGARLTEKRQRYVSPAFQFDAETKRVTSVFNIAICAVPATHGTPALIAASATGDNAMTLEEFLKVVKALGIDMTTPLEEAMAKIKGDPDASTEDAPPPAGDGGADETTEVAKAPAAAPAAEEKPAEVAAALSSVMRLSGKTSFVAAAADIATWHASHLKLETETQKLAAERLVLESAERRKGCVDLVVLAGRAPASVWSDDKSTAPKPVYERMSIADFREYVANAIAANGGKKGGPVPPPSAAPTVAGLTPEQIKICKDTGCDPALFAKLTAQRDSVKTGGT